MRLSISKLPRPLGALLFSSFLAFQAGAASLPAGVTEAASIEGITEYRLSNGLRVLLVPDESKPSTTVNMTYLVGSRNENYGQTGMAHLLEHMLFKGTSTTRNAMGEFSRRGLQANGSTSSDRTNYFASFAANPETLKWYLGWQADAMVNSLIAKEDLDSEMTVVRNEMESGENSPSRILMQKMQAAAFQWHSYGKNTIGARSDVENVDIGQLRAFYHEYYQPDNAVLIVAGKFDPQATLADIEETLASCPSRTASCRPNTPWNPCRTANARSRCAALAAPRWSLRCTTSLPPAAPISCRWTWPPSSCPTRRRAACTMRSSPPSWPRVCSVSPWKTATRAWRCSARNCPPARIWTPPCRP